jgi:hypothetical protein
MLTTLAPTILTGGGGDDPKKKEAAPLTPQEMNEWNSFIRFMKQKGVAGSKDLDKRDKNRGRELFNEFKAANPNVSIDYSVVPRAQAEFLKFQQFHKGFKQRKGMESEDQFDHLSPQDGWLGSYTSQQELIPMKYQQTDSSGRVVNTANMGLMNGLGQPVSAPQHQKALPKGVQLEKLKDAQGREFYGYPDESGDIKVYQYIN